MPAVRDSGCELCGSEGLFPGVFVVYQKSFMAWMEIS